MMKNSLDHKIIEDGKKLYYKLELKEDKNDNIRTTYI